MSKEIKDYLHLYLGCEAEIEFIDSAKGRTKLECAHVQGVLTPELVKMVKSCKPILRPLSDMTEEEFEDFKKIADSDFCKMTVIDAASKDGITRLAHKFNATAYLLSKHFDLFGLIESGLAIDKTKTTNP